MFADLEDKNQVIDFCEKTSSIIFVEARWGPSLFHVGSIQLGAQKETS